MTLKPSSLAHVSQDVPQPKIFSLPRPPSHAMSLSRTKIPRKRKTKLPRSKQSKRPSSGRRKRCSSPCTEFPETYEDGVGESTRTKRASMWSQLKQLVDGTRPLQSWMAILQQQQQYARSHGRFGGPMMWSSQVTLLASTIGCMKKYAPELGRPSPAFYAEMDRLKALHKRDSHLTHKAFPATWPQIFRLITELEEDGDWIPALFLFLLWVTASRGSSVSMIQAHHVHISPCPASTDSCRLAIVFCEGKTMKHTDAYCIHVEIPTTAATLLSELRQTRRKFLYLFPEKTQKSVAAALKQVGLEIRSTRVGALRTMAAAGAPPEKIRLFSRHTTNAALYQYLGSGLHCAWEAETMYPLSRTLQQ